MTKASEKKKLERAVRPRFRLRWIVLVAILAISGLTVLIGASSKRLDNVESLPVDASAGATAFQTSVEPPPARRPVFSYQVIKSRSHDPGAFTQGLVYLDGFLYESTGLNGASSLRKVDLETGQVLTKIDIPSQYFAEGLAIFNDRMIQLTWQHHIGFVYQLADFQKLQEFSYTGEGWGLTHDAQLLIMSDGTNRIRFLDPQSFQVRRTIDVFDGPSPVVRLNELEYIDGEIWANVWLTDRIVRIHPTTGKVTSWVDLTGLLPSEDRHPSVDVLNGIAYDPAGRRLFLTGKRWPKLFEVKITTKRSSAHR
jgi:glutamine cyclotransferase